jgi:hypothetical protein
MACTPRRPAKRRWPMARTPPRPVKTV